MEGYCQPSDEAWLKDNQYQAILQAVPVIAFEYDAQTGTETAGPYVGALVKGDFAGGRFSETLLRDGSVHPQDRHAFQAFFQSVRQTGAVSPGIFRLKTPGDEYHCFRMVCCPSPYHPGRAQYLGCIADLHEETSRARPPGHPAEHDALTGLYNRDGFFRRVAALLQGPEDGPYALIRFDVDRFKIINALYSPGEGDRVLKGIGDVLRGLMRPGEICARMHNDVFCMFLLRDIPQTLQVMEEVERQAGGIPRDFRLSLSAGILPVAPREPQLVSILCDLAALAQRTVKGNFIQKYAVYDERMRLQFNREHQLTSEMRQALDAGQFHMYLQPKFDLENDKLIGAEALVRWRHPGEGLIRPDEFIPLFERNGFIMQLDAYIWEEACKKLRDWQDRGLPPLPISVNVSRVHIYDEGFCDQIQSLTRRYGVPPLLLELEVTESAYTEKPQRLYAVMERLQRQGFSFSMDDFGSGYSSLNVLKDIPVDMVKIDLNFLRKARRGDDVGKRILAGTIELVHSLGLPVLAEGVETREQVELLLQAGCTRGQGYYYGAPVPAPEFEKTFLEHRKEADLL